MADIVIRQGDTLPGISAILQDETGVAIQLPTGSTCQLLIRDQAGTVLVTGTATIADQNANPGLVTYAWQPTDTVSPFTGTLTWRVTFPSGNSLTWPTVGADTVEVVPVWTPSPPISLAEVKTALNYDDTDDTDDAEIEGFLRAAVSVIEAYVGPIVPTSYTQRLFPGNRLIIPLSRRPVIAVTSIVQAQIGWWAQGAFPIDVADVWLDGEAGTIQRVDGFPFPFAVDITYTAGRLSLEPNVRLAILELVEHTWQRSQQTLAANPGGDPYSQMPGANAGVPYRVLELLAGQIVPGIA